MHTVSPIGLDTANNVCQVHAVEASGEVVMTRRLRRAQVLGWFARLERVDDCVAGLEATGGSHYRARELGKLGYRVGLLNPQAVKAYRHGQKSDTRDAAAICEAAGRAAVAEAPVKGAAQQAILAQQASRRRLVNQRTALGNQPRGLVRESGVVIARGWAALKRRLVELADDADNGLADGLRQVLAGGCDELIALERRIAAWDRRFEAQAHGDERCRRLMAQRGVGALTALRLVAIGGEGTSGRARRCA